VPTYPHLASLLVIAFLALPGCSRDKPADHSSEEEGSTATRTKGDDISISKVKAGARALAQPDATVDYVAAEMEGVIKARTKSQVLMHYDGYRVTMTAPGDRVTQITFELVEARPTVAQLTDAFGKPDENPKGMLYSRRTEATESTILILAEPESLPADENSLVRRITIAGKRGR